jgi:hypothetical protein
VTSICHHYVLLAITFVSCFFLVGCKDVLYGSALTSAVVVYDLERYALPSLEEIDRVEVQYEAKFFSPSLVRRSLSKPEELTDLVRLFNDNRSSWKNPQLVLTPNAPNPYSGPDLRILSFWSKNNIVRVVHVCKRTLIAQYESRKIVRELSQAESDAIYRLLAAASQ